MTKKKPVPLTSLSPAEREFRALNPTRSYKSYMIESAANAADSALKRSNMRCGPGWIKSHTINFNQPTK